MKHKHYFQMQAGNLSRDYKTQYQDEGGLIKYEPRFFNDTEDIVTRFDIKKDDKLPLQKAQHIVAKLAGFHKWPALTNASETMQELGKLLLENRDDLNSDEWVEYIKGRETVNPFKIEWTDELKLQEFKTKFLDLKSPYRKSVQKRYGDEPITEDASKAAVYYLVKDKETFEHAAQTIYGLTATAQRKQPNKERILVVEVEGNKNSAGGFNKDIHELLMHFLPDMMIKHVKELVSPFGRVLNSTPQVNDFPELSFK